MALTTAILEGNEVESPTLPRTQVYKATHDGNKRLSYMQRSFISFSFGGRNIEDFNLIAVTVGDRLSREGYATFEDLTSIYDTIQGQFYWGTYFHNNSLTLNLATDGMSQPELDDFKNWFIAGATRELILAEHPNRAIMARVAQAPQLELLPFESQVTLTIGESIYTTSTTLYRGEITLELTMDEPFWYAKQNVLGIQNTNEGYYDENWVDANGNAVQVRTTPDALKIIYEDHIPLGSVAQVSVFLGGDIYAAVVYKIYSFIVEGIDEETYNIGKADADPEVAASYYNNGFERINSLSMEMKFADSEFYRGAVIAELDANGHYLSGAKIGGADLTSSGENSVGVEIPMSEIANLYYAGTAPAPVNVYFTLTPIIDTTTQLIISPYNSIGHMELPYNTISLVSKNQHNFVFTVPDIYASYNQTILLIDALVRAKGAWMTVREQIRILIRHPVVRAWANRILDKYDLADGTGLISGETEEEVAAIKEDLKYGMSFLFKNETGSVLPASFSFNGKTGVARGTFTYRSSAKAVGDTQWIDYGTENFITQEEDVGDMVKSNYLTLDERNTLSAKFQIQAWSEEHPDYAYKVTHDVPGGLRSVRFEFQNMYL